jgi:hypothetical protein
MKSLQLDQTIGGHFMRDACSRVSQFVMISVALLALGGCLVAGNSETKRTGTDVPESTFSQIQPGKTTVGWVQATLGEPTTKSKVDDHEVWKYSYTVRTDNSGAIFLIFGGHSTDEKTHNAFVEFKDGLVINKWRG